MHDTCPVRAPQGGARAQRQQHPEGGGLGMQRCLRQSWPRSARLCLVIHGVIPGFQRAACNKISAWHRCPKGAESIGVSVKSVHPLLVPHLGLIRLDP